MKRFKSGLLAGILLIFGGAANAVSFTPSAPVPSGSPITVTADVGISGLILYDVFLGVAANTGLIQAYDDRADGGVMSYQAATASTIALNGGEYSFTGLTPVGSTPNLGFSFGGLNGLLGFRVTGVTPGFDKFKLDFAYTATAEETDLFWAVRQYTAAAPTGIYTSGSLKLVTTPAIPLPAGAPLALSGLAALALLRRKKARAA
ncbi:hypothetical protein OB2597_16040 [Pseudooceanicola batsensis HTCC2597]|uniref:VPLPA-CTERM protein sorting domain-containing protein n=1 Tax=Pseudooceanicola batsensis (strain ATCC BAA-863 / DSM 15984 / KCTC 12145 / HTCC2597) TaxID=252305 RepID=A3TZ90_PSEBH|nr:hypothetical protein [Pseudooceanicola batsensis]EAQ02908.1 hypothetical protein OB2597_16040 [Pseudooceanicola batsensis HTCC2597]